MPDSVLLEFDKQAYSIEAIQKAAYRSINTLTTDISVDKGVIACTLTPDIDVTDSVFAHAIQEFKKDVIDQHLRLKLKAESEPIRNLILGVAFSKTGLQSSE